MVLTVNELFSGIGSQRKALEKLGIPHKVIGISEIDKYAISSYEAIFGSTYNYGDISRVEKLNYADFWTYSFPCTDISVAGRQAGINERTRSGLLYQVERLLNQSKEHGELPKYLMLENVKNLVGKNFKEQFDKWLQYLAELGYINYWQVLNAKDYGIPQNRERVFVISIRKDIDNHTFCFPKPFDSGIRLKDLLETEVDEKHYVSDEIQKRFKQQYVGSNIIGTTKKEDGTSFGQRDWVYNPQSLIGALTATDYKQPKQIIENNIKQVGLVDIKGHDLLKRVYSPEGCSPTLSSMQCGNTKPKITEPSITAAGNNSFKIRKLTPKECWRLMGFDDKDFEKAEKVNSNTQLYKQAGNSIVVDVLYHIFRNSFKDYITKEESRIAANFIQPPISSSSLAV